MKSFVLQFVGAAADLLGVLGRDCVGCYVRRKAKTIDW